MSNTSLTPELVKLTTELASAFAQCQKVVSANARIRLFYQNAEATDLFRKVNEYGEELRNKHMAGMPPSEEEIAKFDALRQNVVENDTCRGFVLPHRSTLNVARNLIVRAAPTQKVTALSCYVRRSRATASSYVLL